MPNCRCSRYCSTSHLEVWNNCQSQRLGNFSYGQGHGQGDFKLDQSHVEGQGVFNPGLCLGQCQVQGRGNFNPSTPVMPPLPLKNI